MASEWAQWRLKSPASWLFTQPFIQTQIEKNTKRPRHWPLCGEFTGGRWIPRTKVHNAEKVSIWWRHHDFHESWKNMVVGTCKLPVLVKEYFPYGSQIKHFWEVGVFIVSCEMLSAFILWCRRIIWFDAIMNQREVMTRVLEVLYVFEHKTQYLFIHAPYTGIVVFWHTSNIPHTPTPPPPPPYRFRRVKLVNWAK